MFEAFECFLCRKVMTLFGADASRCPGCGSVHGKVVTQRHFGKGKVAGRRARSGRQAKKA
jgi:Zn finger protein HypA/HybF involved in hydrogenase expression